MTKKWQHIDEFLEVNNEDDENTNTNRNGKYPAKIILNDPNNNETILGDDETVTEKYVKDYLQQYNKWQQSKLGATLTRLIRNWLGYTFDAEIKWNNVLFIGGFHLVAVLAFLKYVWYATLVTYLWGITVGGFAGFGVTAGAHRLWTHRAYKAKLPLRILLLCCFCTSGQYTIHRWVRDHRVHHKYSETDADPYNTNRGFLFAHVGWLLLRKHPEVIKKGYQIDMTDVTSDPVASFHKKHFMLLKIVFCFILPTFIPWYFFGEAFEIALFSQCFVRYVLSVNTSWLVNSAGHMYGNRPYDKFASIVSMGEGWHNYHHVFPWDYKAAELGNYPFNLTTFGLDLFSKIGWAYDLKQPSKDLVRRTIEKHGDGSYLPEVPDPEISR